MKCFNVVKVVLVSLKYRINQYLACATVYFYSIFIDIMNLLTLATLRCWFWYRRYFIFSAFLSSLKCKCCKIACIKPLYLKKSFKTLKSLSTLFWYDSGIICYERKHIDAVLFSCFWVIFQLDVVRSIKFAILNFSFSFELNNLENNTKH